MFIIKFISRFFKFLKTLIVKKDVHNEHQRFVEKVFMNIIVCALKLFFKFKQIYTNDFLIPNVEIY